MDVLKKNITRNFQDNGRFKKKFKRNSIKLFSLPNRGIYPPKTPCRLGNIIIPFPSLLSSPFLPPLCPPPVGGLRGRSSPLHSVGFEPTRKKHQILRLAP